MRCEAHPACPGCPLLGVAYEEQLVRKRARLERALAWFPHLRLPPPEPVVPSPHVEGYRHRLKLPVQVEGDRVAIGLYARSGRRVLDTPDCPVLDHDLREGLRAMRPWLAGRRGVHAVDLRRSRASGELQLVLACAGGELDGGPRAARALMRRVPALGSVAVSRADPERKRVMGSQPRVIAGRAWLEERIGDTRYHLVPGAFFQVDPRQAAALHQLVEDAVGTAATVLDLYAGVGAYALRLAPGRARVLAVEEVPQAAAAAAAVAPPNVEVLAGRAEDLAEGERFEAAVLNPTRRGADPEVLAGLARRTDRLVYVSCGPETLARDLDVLAHHGLAARWLRPIDLFPQTPEVETVVLLERTRPLESWPTPGGRAGSPWGGGPSGAVGKPTEAIVLALGDTGPRGTLPGARYERLEVVATHSLLRLTLSGSLPQALRTLASRGHPPAGKDPRTRRFFADKAGLVRPFVHVARAGRAEAPLHGDLVLALEALREAPEQALRPKRGRPRGRGARG